MSIFKKYSKYYDLFYKDKNYKKESAYIYKIISHYYQDPLHLLNLGCGTGNHDFFLANHGLHLTSIDSSPEAIKTANEKKKESGVPDNQIKFNRADIRKFKINKKFDCATALFHVINYLNTNKDISDCFNAVNKHLKKGGLFLFDSWYGPAVLNDLPEKRIKAIKQGGIKIIRKSLPTLYPNKNIAQIKFHFELRNNKNKTISFNEVHKMRYLFSPEVELLLNMSNFELLHSEEWMTGHSPDLNSWYVLFVARKI